MILRLLYTKYIQNKLEKKSMFLNNMIKTLWTQIYTAPEWDTILKKYANLESIVKTMPVNMKKICLSLILLMSSPWLMATENKKPAEVSAKAAEIPNTFTVKTRPEIVGLWGMEIPDNK